MKMGKCVNLRRLADKIYRSRPVRNGMIIATIVLMTCLIMSVAGVMEAADYITRQENMRNFGTTAQGIYTGLTREQYEALKQMAGITEVAGEAYLGAAAENMGNTQVYVYYASEECAAENFHGLTVGNGPFRKQKPWWMGFMPKSTAPKSDRRLPFPLRLREAGNIR